MYAFHLYPRHADIIFGRHSPTSQVRGGQLPHFFVCVFCFLFLLTFVVSLHRVKQQEKPRKYSQGNLVMKALKIVRIVCLNYADVSLTMDKIF